MLQEYDVIRLMRRLPEHDLEVGAIGAIVMIYNSHPPEYEVEFCDNNGITLALVSLKEEDLEKIEI